MKPDPEQLPKTHEVKNRDILIVWDPGKSYLPLTDLLWQLGKEEIRSITIMRKEE